MGSYDSAAVAAGAARCAVPAARAPVAYSAFHISYNLPQKVTEEKLETIIRFLEGHFESLAATTGRGDQSPRAAAAAGGAGGGKGKEGGKGKKGKGKGFSWELNAGKEVCNNFNSKSGCPYGRTCRRFHGS